jgi:MFS transporter, ACS family, allantoate permease
MLLKLCVAYVLWQVIGICYAVCPVLLLVIRYYLSRENKRRDTERPDNTYDDVYVKMELDGKTVETKVDKVLSRLLWKWSMT